MSGTVYGFGYTTNGAKDVIMLIPCHALGKASVTASGTASLTIRGGNGATGQYTFDASSLNWSLDNDGTIIAGRLNTSTAYSGGNNVSHSFFLSGVTFTFA